MGEVCSEDVNESVFFYGFFAEELWKDVVGVPGRYSGSVRDRFLETREWMACLWNMHRIRNVAMIILSDVSSSRAADAERHVY